MVLVNRELGLFSSMLDQKPQLVAINKVDLPEVQARLAQIKGAFRSVGTEVIFISAVTGEGVATLTAEAMKMLGQVAAEVQAGEKIPKTVFRPQPRDPSASVHKEGDTFVVVAPELERIVAWVDMTSPDVRQQLQRQLAKLGVNQALERAGAKPGDRVRCGNCEWEW
jgi:GTP-binding protein